jgi:hypothetical protein
MVEEQLHRDADDDRPLREARMPPELLRPGEIEYRTCPYAGSRQGQPMNVSALKQTGARWDEIADALAFLRAAYTDARGGAYAPDLLDVWRVSQLGSALPWFYILQDPLARTPAFAAALSKATLGTGILTQRLFVELLSTQRFPDVSAAGLLDAAEWTDTMVGDSEVCAASEKMILRFVEILVAPGRTYEGVGGVAALAARQGAVLGFGAHYIAYKHLVWLYYLARRFLYADLVAALGDHELASGARTLLEDPCEPPDFFVIGPEAMAEASLERRGVWFRTLALPLVPFAPGGADAAQCARALELADAMAADPDAAAGHAAAAGTSKVAGHAAAAGTSEAAAEIARVTGIAPSAAALAGRALAQYVRLDAWFGDVADGTESGFRTALGHPARVRSSDAALRDCLLPTSPRRYLATLAPAYLAARARR